MNQVEVEVATGLALVVGAVVWMIRLEGRVNHIEKMEELCQKDLDSLKVEHQTLLTDVSKELARVREGLSELKGIIKGMKLKMDQGEN